MSESSRWSGESEIPEKMVWFNEVLDVDENGEITYLEDESRQWERKGEWYGYEGNEDGPYQYVHVDEKKLKSSDHRELSAYQVQRSLIRAKILEEVVEDVYRKRYFPVTKESTIVFEYDRNKDEIKEHFSEVLALVTNDEADEDDGDDNDVIPAAQRTSSWSVRLRPVRCAPSRS